MDDTLSLEVVVVLRYLVVDFHLGTRGKVADGSRLVAADAAFDILLVLELAGRGGLGGVGFRGEISSPCANGDGRFGYCPAA